MVPHCLEIATIRREPCIRRKRTSADRAGSNDMKRTDASLALAVVLCLSGWVLMTPANAAPPTVTPSPGYDARLQEQHAASSAQPAAPAPRPVHRRRVKPVHNEAH
jgi:hypothetical protein